MMKTAVCLTAYNRADMIVETFDSLVAQTMKEFKVFICRDGSTDNIDEIIDVYSNKLIIKASAYRTDTSVGLAKNRSIELALEDNDIEYIQILDSDDLMMPEMLETNLKTMADNSADWVLCCGRTIGRNSGYVPSWIASMDEMYTYNPMHSWVMAKTHVFQKYMFKPFSGNEDWDWWIHILKDNNLKGCINPLQVHRYRVHNGRISETLGVSFQELKSQIEQWNPK